MDWLTPADADLLADLWPDSTLLDPGVLAAVLLAAAGQCAAFAPAGDITAGHRMAQALQARAITLAGAVATDGTTGQPYPVVTYPMDWAVKALLRPPTPPKVG